MSFATTADDASPAFGRRLVELAPGIALLLAIGYSGKLIEQTIAAYGKARVAYEAGRRMPPGALIDANGEPTDDPRVMFEDPLGALLPFAGHKGYALAVMCEVLGGAMSGGTVQDHVHDPNPMLNNMLSFVFDAPGYTVTGLVRPAAEKDAVEVVLTAAVR